IYGLFHLPVIADSNPKKIGHRNRNYLLIFLQNCKRRKILMFLKMDPLALIYSQGPTLVLFVVAVI
ncbi:mCG146220, partial [Mus musculus]